MTRFAEGSRGATGRSSGSWGGEVVMAPAFFWFVVVMPPTLLAAALLPPARPLRGRRLTLGLAGGVVIAVALLLLLGLVLPLLDVGVNVKT